MSRIIIALGSKSTLKAVAVERACREMERVADIHSVDVSSGVSAQPEGLEEMTMSAIERALSAIQKVDGATYGIGIENGLIRARQGFDFCLNAPIAAVVDPLGIISIGLGPGLRIPNWAIEEAQASDLGAVVMKRGAPDKNPVGYFSEGEIDRIDTLAWAVKMAFMSYRHPGRHMWHS